MVYAQVAVRSRGFADLLTYQVPAQILPYLKVGSLVSVPLRRKVTQGVVFKFSARKPKQFKSQIREIISVEKGQLVRVATLKLIEQLTAHYGASLSEVAFWVLDKERLEIERPRQTNFSLTRPLFITGNLEQRLKTYHKLIENRPEINYLFVFAQTAYAQFFYQQLPKARRQFMETDGKSTGSIQKVTSQQPLYKVGSLGSIFTNLNSGDALIVDQPYHPGSKFSRRPYLSAKTIALFRRLNEKLRLVFGSELVSVEDLPLFNKGQYQLKAWPLPSFKQFSTDQSGTKESLGPSLQAMIAHELENQHSVLVFSLTTGGSTALICSNCASLIRCPNCQQVCQVRKESFSCPYCGHHQPVSQICPACGGQLRSIGEGVEKISNYLQKKFPGQTVVSISGDKPAQRVGQLTVATEKVLAYPQAKFDNLVIANVDQSLISTQLNAAWRLAANLIELVARSKNIYIQTHLTEHPLWQALSKRQLAGFLEFELRERKKLGLPPYAWRLSLVGLARSYEQALKEAEIVEEQIRQKISKLSIWPSRVRRTGQRSYRVELDLICTSEISQKNKTDLAAILPKNWHLDVD